MKASSIVTIREILMDEQKKSREAYELFKEKMIDKYQTDWFDNKMNETESKLFRDLKVRHDDLSEALADFEKYEW